MFGIELAQPAQPLPRDPRAGSASTRRTSRRPTSRGCRGSGSRCATKLAMASMSYVRTRVASSDWCASRNVVSVSSSRFCCVRPRGEPLRPELVEQLARAARRRAGDRAAEPARLRSVRGTRLARHLGIAVDDDVGRGRSAAWSRGPARGAKRNSAGVSSRNVVVALPAWKVGLLTTFSRNGMLVLTPRMRNSRSARSMRWQACGNSRPQAVIFTSSES